MNAKYPPSLEELPGAGRADSSTVEDRKELTHPSYVRLAA